MSGIEAAQPLFLAAVLAWSGTVKAAGSGTRARVAGTALHRLLGGRLAAPAFVAVGVVELAVAVALVAIPGRTSALAAGVLALGFLGYLAYGAVAAPQSSCGCLGRRHVPMSRRAFARAGMLLLAASAAALADTQWWWSVRAAATGAAVAVEAAVFVMLSPELDRYWLTPLRKLRIRLTRPLAGAPDVVPLHATVTQLHRSEAYRRVAPLLASDIREHWDADDWRILCYAVRLSDRRATAVFAVPRLRDEPSAVRVSVVDDPDGAVAVPA